MNTAKIVESEPASNSSPVVLEFLAERIREARESARPHAHAEILALNDARAELLTHLSNVMTLMRACDSWEPFKKMIDKSLPKFRPMPLLDGVEGIRT